MLLDAFLLGVLELTLFSPPGGQWVPNTTIVSVAIRDTSLGIGPILLGRIFDYVLQPSPPNTNFSILWHPSYRARFQLQIDTTVVKQLHLLSARLRKR
jgi:hypothetical protein